MARTPERIELRDPTAEWPGDLDNDYVARWTDNGWAYWERSGFPSFVRRQMDIDVSILLLDLEQEAKRENRSVISRRLKSARKHISKAKAQIDAVLRAYDYPPELLIQMSGDLARFEEDLTSAPGGKERRNRKAFFEYVCRVDLVAIRCGIPLKRSKTHIEFVTHLRDTVSPCVERYLSRHVDPGRARRAAAELRHLNPEGLIRPLTKLG